MKFYFTIIFSIFLTLQLSADNGIERWSVKPQTDFYENKVGAFVENLTLKSVNGDSQSLYSRDKAFTVITIFDIDCPISLKLVPKVQILEKEFPQVSFRHILISKLVPEKEALKEYQRRKLSGQLLIDDKKTFTKLLAVKTTCENFIIDNRGTLRYRGAIDDQYGINIVKDKIENHYLRDALKNLLTGKPVTTPLTGAPGCLVDSGSQNAESGDITFHKDISRILQNRCQQCHREGGVGPFELMTYEQIKERRKMISYVVKKDIMPPWFAEDDRKWQANYDLSSAEKETLMKWLSSGTPEGDPNMAPKPIQWPSEGIIKNPDLIIKFPKVAVKAEGFMRYEYQTVKIPIKEDKWVRAVETRTENPQVLHHALTFLTDNPDNSRVNAASGFFAGYVPGATINVFPKDSGKLLPKGSYLIVQLHYTPNGTPVEDEVSVAFKFYNQKPKYESITKSAFTGSLKIPPHEANHSVVAFHRLNTDGYLSGFNPHAHLRAKSFKYELIKPDGQKEVLINIPKYDFNWQINYQPVEPVFAPAGSVVKATAVYDNSANNKNNPDPNVTVRFGEQTNDEMMIAYFEWYASAQTGSSSIAEISNLDTLPETLKREVGRLKEQLKIGGISRQEARQSILSTVKKGIKNGDYTRQEIMKYADLVKNELSDL